MCLYHDSEANREASDGSFPGMWKLVVVLNMISKLINDHANLVSHLTHKLSLKGVQIWKTFAEEKSHLFPTWFLAVKEEPQGAVFVHWLSIGELLELANAIFHKRLELAHALGQNVKAAYQPSGKKTCCPLVVCYFKSFPIDYLSEKRETRIMRDAAMVMTAQRTDRTLTMMVQHILSFHSTPLQRLASTPPGNLPHRAVCYDWLLRMRPLKEAVEVVFMSCHKYADPLPNQIS